MTSLHDTWCRSPHMGCFEEAACWLLGCVLWPTYSLLGAVGRDVSARPLPWQPDRSEDVSFLAPNHMSCTVAHVTCKTRPFQSNRAFWNENHSWILRISSAWLTLILVPRLWESSLKVRTWMSRRLSSYTVRLKMPQVTRCSRPAHSPLSLLRQRGSPESLSLRSSLILCAVCLLHITDRLTFCPIKPGMRYLSSQVPFFGTALWKIQKDKRVKHRLQDFTFFFCSSPHYGPLHLLRLVCHLVTRLQELGVTAKACGRGVRSDIRLGRVSFFQFHCSPREVAGGQRRPVGKGRWRGNFFSPLCISVDLPWIETKWRPRWEFPSVSPQHSYILSLY